MWIGLVQALSRAQVRWPPLRSRRQRTKTNFNRILLTLYLKTGSFNKKKIYYYFEKNGLAFWKQSSLKIVWEIDTPYPSSPRGRTADHQSQGSRCSRPSVGSTQNAEIPRQPRLANDRSLLQLRTHIECRLQIRSSTTTC